MKGTTIMTPFTQATRTDGSTYYTLTNDAPDWLREVVYEMHDDEGPNDWRYETAAYLWDQLADRDPSELDDAIHEVSDGLVDVYTSGLTAWLHDVPSRVQYLSDYLADYGPNDDAVAILMGGQYLAIAQMASLLVEAIREHAQASV